MTDRERESRYHCLPVALTNRDLLCLCMPHGRGEEVESKRADVLTDPHRVQGRAGVRQAGCRAELV